MTPNRHPPRRQLGHHRHQPADHRRHPLPDDGGCPGEWHLRIIRSGIPAGQVVSIDTTFLDNEVIVITPDDIEDLPAFGCQIADQAVLTREPKFVGDAIVAVVAATDRRRPRRRPR